MVVEVEGVQSGKMARRLEKILKELVICPNHQKVDEVPACVRKTACFINNWSFCNQRFSFWQICNKYLFGVSMDRWMNGWMDVYGGWRTAGVR